ncbi:hypothetical protein [Pontiella sulfatireligans]|uniref:hypothetical protein n=1 Tax=Pontiella sulfatireligans TaxID=2750658 RepID=UPI001443EE26|nr:hypothetical protein [Pontiella sulfatireligans]
MNFSTQTLKGHQVLQRSEGAMFVHLRVLGAFVFSSYEGVKQNPLNSKSGKAYDE